MAQQNLATLHSSVKIDFGKTLKQLKQLKKDLESVKKLTDNISSSKALRALNQQNKAQAKQNALLREKRNLLRKADMGRTDVKLSSLGAKDRSRLTQRANNIEALAKKGEIQKAKEKLAEFNHELRKATKYKRHADAASRKLAQAQAKEARATKKAAEAHSKANMAAQKHTNTMKRLRSAIVSMTASYTAFSGGQFANQLGQDIQAAEIMFGTIFEERAPEAMNFMREQANRLGLELVANSKAFAKYAVAAGAAGFGLDEVKEQFLGVAEAGVVFGLSMEQQLGMIRAMEQIASKGTVQMEELKLQMGDRMPAALSIAAKAMGMTRKELIKTIEAGELASKDFIPRFTAELRNMASGGLEAALETPRVAQGQMVMAFQEMMESFFKGGFGDFLKGVFETLRNIFKLLRPFAAVAGAVFAALGSVLEPFRIILGAIVDLFDMLPEGTLEGFTDIVRGLGKAIGWVLSIILSPFRLLLKILTKIAKAFGFVAKAVPGAQTVGTAASNTRAGRAAMNMGRRVGTFVERQNARGVMRSGAVDRAWGGAAGAISAGGNQEVRTFVETRIGFDRRAERMLRERGTRQTTSNTRE